MTVFKYFLLFVASLQAASGFKLAFLIIDVQNCFLKGGNVAVKNSDDVIPTINDILERHRNNFSLVVLTQDWHCANHVSFASQHPSKRAYENILLQYNKQGELCSDGDSCETEKNFIQTLWPDHCIMNTPSANISSRLSITDDDIIVRKGYNCDVDSYSAFNDNGGFYHTELQEILQQNNITGVVIAGLPLDYSVYYTAMDANKLGLYVRSTAKVIYGREKLRKKEKPGYVTFVIEDACRGVDNHDVAHALRDMYYQGISTVRYADVEAIIESGDVSSGSVHRQNYFAVLLQAIAVLTVGMMAYM